MKRPKSYSEEISFIAVVAELVIVLGFSGLVFYHYFMQAEGLSVISCVGVLLADFVACCALHSFLNRRTPLLKWSSFASWVYLTCLTALLAATVWMAMRHDAQGRSVQKQNNTQQSFSRKEKQERTAFLTEQIEESSDPKTKQELRRQLRELTTEKKGKSAAPTPAPETPTFEADSTWEWLYARGINSLPGPSAILCLALLLAISVAKRDEEERAARESAYGVPLAPGQAQPYYAPPAPAPTPAKTETPGKTAGH